MTYRLVDELMNSIKTYILFIAFFFTAFVSLAQSLVVSGPSKVGMKDDYFHVKYSVSASGVSDFKSPQFPGFQVLSGPNVSSFFSSVQVNGSTQQQSSTTFTFTIRPTKVGTFTISPASVKIGDRTVASKPLKISVVEGNVSGGARGHENASGQGTQSIQKAGSTISEHDLFVKVVPSKTKIFEQEAVRLSYKVYARLGVGLQNIMLTKNPDFKDIVSHNIPHAGLEQMVEKIGGTHYKVGTVVEYIVFPQKTGSLDIPSLTFDCFVVQRDDDIDELTAHFNGGGLVSRKVQRVTSPVKLSVQSLPEPRPANYMGGVGRFNLSGKLSSPHIATNEIASYNLTISGTGNMNMIVPPKINFPADFEVYEVKTIDSTRVTSNGVEGKVTFQYDFVPRNPGKYTIEGIDIGYFDIENRQFATLHKDSLQINVVKGKKSDSDLEKELALRREDIRPNKPAAGSDLFDKPVAFWKDGAIWFAYGLVALLLGMAIWYYENAKKNGSGLLRRYMSRPLNRLYGQFDKASAQLLGQDVRKAVETIQNAIAVYFAKRFADEKNYMLLSNIREELAAHKVNAVDVDNFVSLYEQTDMLRYAPGNSDNTHNLIESLREQIKSIDSQIK